MNQSSSPTANGISPNRAESGQETAQLDLDRLAYAVSIAETSGCTKGQAITRQNCHGIKSGNTYLCKDKKRTMCTFSSHDESFKAFKIIWGTHYKKFPTLDMAERWTGHDNAKTWLRIVTSAYK